MIYLLIGEKYVTDGMWLWMVVARGSRQHCEEAVAADLGSHKTLCLIDDEPDEIVGSVYDGPNYPKEA